jgi:hypothetical protein
MCEHTDLALQHEFTVGVDGLCGRRNWLLGGWLQLFAAYGLLHRPP